MSVERTVRNAERPDVNQVRKSVRQALDQAKKDEGYKERFYTDPRGALIEAGVSEEAADHLIAYELSTGFVADAPKGQSFERASGMQSQLYCHATCDFWTCIITTCTWFTGV